MTKQEIYNKYKEQVLPLYLQYLAGNKSSLDSNEVNSIRAIYKALVPSYIGCATCSIKNILEHLYSFYLREKVNFEVPEVKPEVNMNAEHSTTGTTITPAKPASKKVKKNKK